MNQQTIKTEVKLSGIGLHTGKRANVTIKPAGEGKGIVFKRVDLAATPSITLCATSAVMDTTITRCTAIEANGARVYTVEHLLAALHGAGIDNVTIEIDEEEVPGLDGSSKEFLQALTTAGIVEQPSPREYIEIKEPITVSSPTGSVTILPADDFQVKYTLDYDHPALRLQTFEQAITPKAFEQEIASARTFCLESEVELIRSKGLGLGANHQNTVVMGKDGPIGNTLRFKDECARHKVLDIVGDLFLLGKPLRGIVVGVKSGHALNRMLVKKIMEQSTMTSKVYDINDIMKILPHRYPFLLIDRVTVTEPGKKGIGLKNVTINDSFFAGHFPQRPVMPGVIMIEALAQTAGVVVLTSGDHPDKVALFMSVNDVKFRKVVMPGDQLMLEVEVIRDRERTSQVKGVGKVGNDVVVEAEMMFSYTDLAYLNK